VRAQAFRPIAREALILLVIPESRSDIRTAFAGLQTRTPQAARRASVKDGASLPAPFEISGLRESHWIPASRE
jgi:hypothetical protein